jgi:hypothetical protein
MLSRDGDISLYSSYRSYKEFADHLLKQMDLLKVNHSKALKEIKMIFLPTSDWDQANGDPEIANRICNLMEKISV